jgi:hypothetical protein
LSVGEDDRHQPSDPRQEDARTALWKIKKLDDCFGQFLVYVSCASGASREIEPEALAPQLRCSQRGKKAAEVVADHAGRVRQREGKDSESAMSTFVPRNLRVLL